MDRTFRVPRTSIKLQLTSPNIYHSPRTITLNRIFQKVLSDDLNSYVYDASVAGCNYSVDCVPSAYRISVSGYSEKIPHLLDVVTSRIASLIEEMKEGDDAHPGLAKLFHKAEENLLRQTKKYVVAVILCRILEILTPNCRASLFSAMYTTAPTKQEATI